MDFLQMLPVEISIIILTLLDLRDILSCQAVCHAWYNFINNNAIWKTFWDKNIPLKECRPRTDLSMTLGVPCKWKMYLMNHIRVIKNWREGRYKRYETNGSLVREKLCSPMSTTEYDGKTLVIKTYLGLQVYKIERGNLIHVQNLILKNDDQLMCKTNTNYIAAKFKAFVLIYQLVNDKYRPSHMLYTNGMNPKLICAPLQFDDIEKLDEIKDECTFFMSFLLEIICIIEHTLYVHLPIVNVLQAWDLKELRTLMEANLENKCCSNDKTKVYVLGNNVINVYDQSGKICFCVKIGNMARILVNQNKLINFTSKKNYNKCRILVNQNLFLNVNAGENIMEICCWDKVTGKEFMTTKIVISYNGCLIHPKENILFVVDQPLVMKPIEIFAFDLKDGATLWKTQIRHNSLARLLSIVADKFLLLCTYEKSLFLYDTETGKYLYSLQRIQDFDAFASYDTLIHINPKNLKTIIDIYS